MDATQELRDEHEGIKVVLAVLDRLADDLQAGKPVNLDDLDQILDFLRTFADKCHHGKEEDLLFPALAKIGIPTEGGPIGVMLAEHTHGRDYIRAMNESLAKMHQDDQDARRTFAEAAHGYAQLLRDHIAKENNVLFMFAEQRLPPEEHARLLEAFARLEEERIGAGVHERFHELLHRLRDTYLMPPAAQA